MPEEYKRESELLKSVQRLEILIAKNEKMEKMKKRVKQSGGAMGFMEKQRNPLLRKINLKKEFQKFGNI